MKLYIASHSQVSARDMQLELEQAGHSITSRWITHDWKFGHPSESAYTDGERRDIALMDQADIQDAEGLVLIAEAVGKTVPGGKHVETGIAIALKLPVFVVGRRENIFHWHPLVHLAKDTPELIASLREWGDE